MRVIQCRGCTFSEDMAVCSAVRYAVLKFGGVELCLQVVWRSDLVCIQMFSDDNYGRLSLVS